MSSLQTHNAIILPNFDVHSNSMDTYVGTPRKRVKERYSHVPNSLLDSTPNVSIRWYFITVANRTINYFSLWKPPRARGDVKISSPYLTDINLKGNEFTKPNRRLNDSTYNCTTKKQHLNFFPIFQNENKRIFRSP